MSIAKIIEVVAEGSSIEGAVQNAINETSKSIHGIVGASVLKFHAVVDNNKIIKYRVDAKISFVVDE